MPIHLETVVSLNQRQLLPGQLRFVAPVVLEDRLKDSSQSGAKDERDVMNSAL